MAAAEIRIELRSGDVVVHKFVRATSQPTVAGVHKMVGGALGWLQAYQGSLTEATWQNDILRALEAQELEP